MTAFLTISYYNYALIKCIIYVGRFILPLRNFGYTQIYIYTSNIYKAPYVKMSSKSLNYNTWSPNNIYVYTIYITFDSWQPHPMTSVC